MNADVIRAQRCVEHYRKLGLCPLPSRTDYKGPALETYTDHYGPTPVPRRVYETWSTTNVQILCGTRTPTPTKILVVDCDGDTSQETWNRILEHHSYRVSTGWVAYSGGGGIHNYFLIPPGIKECPSGIIWGLWDTWGKAGLGKWCKHTEIRIIADGSLIVAPPSVHVDTGRRYEFHGQLNPNRVELPEVAPNWLLAMPRLSNPRFDHQGPLKPPASPRLFRTSGQEFSRQDVLNAIPPEDKFTIARDWGLAVAATRPNPRGWSACFVPGREDPSRSRPSGSFCWRDGTLQDRLDGSTISFFDLGVALDQFGDWRECCNALGASYLGNAARPSTN